MKTVVFLLSVITLVGSVAAQSSMQPPPLYKKRTQASSTRRNAARNPYRANPARDNHSSLYGDSVDTPASKLTTELDDAIRLQSSDGSMATGKSPRSIYDLDRSKVRLAGGEDDSLKVAPTQFMPNQDFSNRPANGFLSARDSDRKDPATGNGLKLAPIPTAPSSSSLQLDPGPKLPLDYGKPAGDLAEMPKKESSYIPANGNTGDSLYGDNSTGNNRNDSASVYRTGHEGSASRTNDKPFLPTIPDTGQAKSNQTYIPAASAGSNVPGQKKPGSMFEDDSFNFKRNDTDAGYASDLNSTGQPNGNRPPAPRTRNGQSPRRGYGDMQGQSREQRRQARLSNPNFSQPGAYGTQAQTTQPQTTQPLAAQPLAAQPQPAPIQQGNQHRFAQQPIQPAQQPIQPAQQPIQRSAPQHNILTQPQYAGTTSAYPGVTYPPAATTTPTVVGTPPPGQQIAAPVISPSTNYPNRIAPPDLRDRYRTQVAQSTAPTYKPVTPSPTDVAGENTNGSNGNETNTSGSYNDRNYQQGGVDIMTLLALFASIGLNIYLGWIAYDTYNRYQDLVADMRRTPARRTDRRERRTERRVTEAAY